MAAVIDAVEPKQLRLSEAFLEPYKTAIPAFGPLGWVTYMRTYSRWIEDLEAAGMVDAAPAGRREAFWETIRRVVEGDLRRMEQAGDSRPDAVKLAEAERMYHYFFSFGVTPSGRNYWMSGTDYERSRGGDALNNCWWVPIRMLPGERPSNAFKFVFDRLMTGGGVGFGVRRRDLAAFSAVKNAVVLTIMCKKTHPNFDIKKMTARKYRGRDYFRVPDTREGWAEAFALLIDAHFDGTKHLYIDVSDVRPYGARIRGFGGTSSGPTPLVNLLIDANADLNKYVGDSVRSLLGLDLGNREGKAVVSGGVRRSAEISIGDADDLNFLTAKQDTEALYSHRWASNNTVEIDENTPDEAFGLIAEAIARNGEPGLFNRWVAQNFGRIIDGFQAGIDSEADGLNPCGEITLAPYEPCNLIDVQPFVIWRDGGRLNMTRQEACYLAARYTYRVTFTPYSWQQTQDIIRKNRRTGVSLSGIVDWALSEFDRYPVLGFDANGEPAFDMAFVEALKEMYGWVRAANNEYAAFLGQNPSNKVTTVKPSGTVSLLPGVTPGVHASPGGAYYIRRIRFANSDPLLPLLKACGFPMEPDAYAPNTTTVEFPVASPGADSPAFKGAGDLTIEEQFAMDYLLAYAWADNAVSCTITFKKAEAGKIASLLRQYHNRLKSVSLLPYAGEGDSSGYVQLPYETITKAEYERRADQITAVPEAVYAVYGFIDDGELDGLDLGECATGVCPVK